MAPSAATPASSHPAPRAPHESTDPAPTAEASGDAFAERPGAGLEFSDDERDVLDERVQDYVDLVESDPVHAAETLRAILVACVESCTELEIERDVAREQHDSALADLAVIHRRAMSGSAPAAYWILRLEHERELRELRVELDTAKRLRDEAIAIAEQILTKEVIK